MLEGDGVGLVRYNQDAQVVQQVLPLGAGGHVRPQPQRDTST